MNSDLLQIFHPFYDLVSVETAVNEYFYNVSSNKERIEFLNRCITYHQLNNQKSSDEIAIARMSPNIPDYKLNSMNDYHSILRMLKNRKKALVDLEKIKNAFSFTCNEEYVDKLPTLHSLLKSKRIGFIHPTSTLTNFLKIFLSLPKEDIHFPVVWLGSQRDLIRVFDNLINKEVIVKPSNYAKALSICFCKDASGNPFPYSFEKAIEKVNDSASRNEKKLEEIFSLF